VEAVEQDTARAGTEVHGLDLLAQMALQEFVEVVVVVEQVDQTLVLPERQPDNQEDQEDRGTSVSTR